MAAKSALTLPIIVIRADIVIIGSGVIGSSIALHLRQQLGNAKVVVVERDPTYARASSRLATGGIRQQYCSPLNVAMARHSVDFLARLDSMTAATKRPTRAWFRQRGYLFLANTANAPHLQRRFELERASGAAVEQWTRARLHDEVPGLVSHDVELAIFGPEDGYLDPREVLAGMRALAAHAGAEFIDGEVISVERQLGQVTGVQVATGDTEHRIDTRTVVNAGGAWAATIAAAAGVEVPVTAVRQHLFRLDLDAPLPSRIPMIFDPDGTHWRLDDPRSPGDREMLVIGRSRADEPPGENFEVDPARLHSEMLPTLQRRYPAAQVRSVAEAWAGLYEMTPDRNGIIGEHPELPGFIVAAGFSGHGLMLSPATGLAVAELVADGRCTTFDIAPLAADRFQRGALFLDDALI